MTNRAMLFGALYKLKVMHGQQTYTVCGCSYLCVDECGCYYTRIYIYRMYLCLCVLGLYVGYERKQSNGPVLPHIRLLSLGRDFCTSGGDP